MDNPDVALYIQRGIERDEYKSSRGTTAPPFKKIESVKIPEKKSKEIIFVESVASVILKETGNKKEQQRIMEDIFNKYSESLNV